VAGFISVLILLKEKAKLESVYHPWLGFLTKFTTEEDPPDTPKMILSISAGYLIFKESHSLGKSSLSPLALHLEPSESQLHGYQGHFQYFCFIFLSKEEISEVCFYKFFFAR
jgi:hypothetical protein